MFVWVFNPTDRTSKLPHRWMRSSLPWSTITTCGEAIHSFFHLPKCDWSVGTQLCSQHPLTQAHRDKSHHTVYAAFWTGLRSILIITNNFSFLPNSTFLRRMTLGDLWSVGVVGKGLYRSSCWTRDLGGYTCTLKKIILLTPWILSSVRKLHALVLFCFHLLNRVTQGKYLFSLLSIVYHYYDL